MTIGIVGYGHVGSTMGKLFPDAVIYDPYLADFKQHRADVNDTDVAFVCVPTPHGDAGAADLTAVTEVVEWLTAGIIVLKSTVPPGTTSKLAASTSKRIVFCPEYVGESRFWLPWADNPRRWPFVIVGGDPADTRPVIELLAAALGPQITYRQTSAEAAELAKYMENTWLASQVMFAWQFAQLAEAFGADYWEVRELWALDPRVSKWHTALFTDSPGFGGRCLPKDLAALAAAGRAAGCDVSWLTGLIVSNDALQAQPEGPLR